MDVSPAREPLGGAAAGRSLLWEFSVRGLVLFVALAAVLCWLASTLVERSLTDLRSREVAARQAELDRWMTSRAGGTPGERLARVRALVEERLDDWGLAGVGLLGRQDRSLLCHNGALRDVLVKDLTETWAEPDLPRSRIQVPLAPGHHVPMLVRVSPVPPAAGLGDELSHLVLYAYFADVQREVEVFRLLSAALLLMSMVVLYVALGLVVRRASARMLSYSRQLEERNLELEATKRHLLHSSKLAMLGELGASVAHEIRNPLAAISAGLQVAESKARDAGLDLGEVFVRLTGEIERLTGILTGMLKFSRATGDAAWLNLNVVAEKVVLLIKKRARDQKVIIERRLDEELPDTCGDPWQLEQVALNLVLNALQAMPRGGTLRLQSGASAEEVWLEVRDTGKGVPAEVLARLFTPFLTTRGEEGTGLGLAISKRIVEEHRGQLTLENLEPGVLARVALPLKRPVDGQGPRVDTGGGGAGPAGRGGDGAQGPDNRG